MSMSDDELHYHPKPKMEETQRRNIAAAKLIAKEDANKLWDFISNNFKDAAKLAMIEPEEPDEPTPSPYDAFTFTYEEGILTVSGSGTLPTVTDLAETPLAAFAEECTVIVLADGAKTLQSDAFAGFARLYTLIVNDETTLKDGALEGNADLQTVICSAPVHIEGNPFAGAADILFYEPKAIPHTGALPTGCAALPYSFSDGTLLIEGAVEMDTYDLLDLMAVMCGYFDDVRYVKFNSYTSLDLPFYIFTLILVYST